MEDKRKSDALAMRTEYARPHNVKAVVDKIAKLGSPGITMGDFRAHAEGVIATTSPQCWLATVMHLVNELEFEQARPLAQEVAELRGRAAIDRDTISEHERALLLSNKAGARAAETCMTLRKELADVRVEIDALRKELLEARTLGRATKRELDTLRLRVANPTMDADDAMAVAGSAMAHAGSAVTEWYVSTYDFRREHPATSRTPGDSTDPVRTQIRSFVGELNAKDGTRCITRYALYHAPYTEAREQLARFDRAQIHGMMGDEFVDSLLEIARVHVDYGPPRVERYVVEATEYSGVHRHFAFTLTSKETA